MSTLLIKNGTLVFSDCTKKGDIYAENGVILTEQRRQEYTVEKRLTFH